MNTIWIGINNQPSKSYVCGYCDNFVASQVGYCAHREIAYNEYEYSYIYICHVCGNPTYFDFNNNQFPGALYGYSVKNIESKEVLEIYNEARNCFKVNAYTASVLLCRKLLMNIAVSKGAKEGESFFKYINYLAEKGFVPPDSRELLDSIREKGNEATHEIKMMDESEAKLLVDLSGVILKLIYEFPLRLKESKKQEGDLHF